MTLTNPLTQAIEWGLVLLWTIVVGVAALRALGYTPTSIPMTASLGAVGLVLGRFLFPRTVLDLPWWSFPFEIYPLPGLLWALVILACYRGLDWYMHRDDEPEMEQTP